MNAGKRPAGPYRASNVSRELLVRAQLAGAEHQLALARDRERAAWREGYRKGLGRSWAPVLLGAAWGAAVTATAWVLTAWLP